MLASDREQVIWRSLTLTEADLNLHVVNEWMIDIWWAIGPWHWIRSSHQQCIVSCLWSDSESQLFFLGNSGLFLVCHVWSLAHWLKAFANFSSRVKGRYCAVLEAFRWEISDLKFRSEEQPVVSTSKFRDAFEQLVGLSQHQNSVTGLSNAILGPASAFYLTSILLG